ncbi:MAG: ABC transporter substrate-binding protein [Rhodospirillales bacterium]|nr:ABC transporter substrate-binding protein [Rhodospirillales bacterium]
MRTLSRRALLLAALLMPMAAAQAAEPVKVGVIFPQSGGAGHQGQDVAHAIRAMADLINADGGVLGRPIELLVRDDESTPAVGVAKANELAAQGVAVVIEGWNSPVTLAMQPILARAGILDITAISKADGILASASNPLAIRLNSSNAQDSSVVVDYVARTLKAKRIAFATENDAYGNGAQQGIEAALKQAGWQFDVATVQKFPFPQTDFRVELTSIKDAKPDAVVSINANEGAGLPAFLQQYRQAQVAAPVICSVGTVSPSVIAAAGPAADGLVSGDIYFPDAEPFASNPANQRFVAQVRKEFNGAPDKFMALGAAALQVWAKAANDSKSLERETVARAIRGHTIAGTIFGDAAFLPNGQMLSHYALFTVQQGKIVVAH